jgi:hypothetical protein
MPKRLELDRIVSRAEQDGSEDELRLEVYLDGSGPFSVNFDLKAKQTHSLSTAFPRPLVFRSHAQLLVIEKDSNTWDPGIDDDLDEIMEPVVIFGDEVDNGAALRSKAVMWRNDRKIYYDIFYRVTPFEFPALREVVVVSNPAVATSASAGVTLPASAPTPGSAAAELGLTSVVTHVHPPLVGASAGSAPNGHSGVPVQPMAGVQYPRLRRNRT